MLFKVFSKTIDTSQDMAILEDMLRALLGKENSKKCSFMRSKEYIAFRLMVLYKKEVLQAPMVVYSEGVKICLNPSWEILTRSTPLSAHLRPSPFRNVRFMLMATARAAISSCLLGPAARARGQQPRRDRTRLSRRRPTLRRKLSPPLPTLPPIERLALRAHRRSAPRNSG